MPESIKKLRELLKCCGCSDECYSCRISYDGRKVIDEIEREHEQRVAELKGAICERDGRIGSYERRNTELNDALKVICKRFGVSTEWSAEDTARKVLEALESQYMKLPVDADGVPIFIGDLLKSDETNEQFMCRGYSVTLQPSNGCKWWTVECSYDGYSGTSEYVSAKSCRHVKPDPVRELLEEFADNWNHAKGGCDEEGIFELYADKLREMLGGNEE